MFESDVWTSRRDELGPILRHFKTLELIVYEFLGFGDEKVVHFIRALPPK